MENISSTHQKYKYQGFLDSFLIEKRHTLLYKTLGFVTPTRHIEQQRVLAAKTIYVGIMDEDGVFTGKYLIFKIKNQEHLRYVFKSGHGLVHMAEPEIAITDFDEIKDGGKYLVNQLTPNFGAWTKKDADAMEEETLLSMKAFLLQQLPEAPVELFTEFFDENGRQLQEWDGVLLSGDTLYLLEAKHSMSMKKLKKLAARVKSFPKTLKRSTEKSLAGKFSSIVGVACGTHFPEECRKEAKRLGLMTIYPSGRRYLVDGNLSE